MKLYVKPRAFSWFDNYKIFNEEGESVYSIKGELSWGHCLKMYDMEGKEVCVIRENRDALLPKFEMYVDGNYIGSINKEGDMDKNAYTIDYNDWRVEGDLMETEYRLYNGLGYQVAIMSKEVLSQKDTYRIKITNPEDELLILMITVAIDAEK